MYETLISAADLADLGERCRILDCRTRLGAPDVGSRAYAEGHIPGALYASLDDDLAAAPGAGGRQA